MSDHTLSAPGGPDRPARLHPPGAIFTADQLLPAGDRPDRREQAWFRLQIAIGDLEYRVIPLTPDPEGSRWTVGVRLVPLGEGTSVCCFEWADTADGLQIDGYLGLGCDCPDARWYLCRHVRALVAVGVLRPHPSWDQWDAELHSDEPVYLGAGR